MAKSWFYLTLYHEHHGDVVTDVDVDISNTSQLYHNVSTESDFYVDISNTAIFNTNISMCTHIYTEIYIDSEVTAFV